MKANSEMRKKKAPIKLFVAGFAAIGLLIVVQNVVKQDVKILSVPDNKGTSLLESTGNSVIAIFQDGRTCVWNWKNKHPKEGEFKADSERAIIFGSSQMAAVSSTGKKILSVYTIPSGQKQKELSVGWDDQDVWPRISPDKKAAAIIRKNPADSSGTALYEFMTLDLEKDMVGLPASLSINQKTEAFVDFAVDSNFVLYAVGSKGDLGRMAAFNLQNGSAVWDRVVENTKEFCSIIVSPDSKYLLAGNRDGILYKINAMDGTLNKRVVLLEPGETRPITNDYSVLNLTFSPDGQYYAASIHPEAYVLNASDDKIVRTLTPADRLVSKMAFSPNNEFLATSDIRASYPIKIWPLKK